MLTDDDAQLIFWLKQSGAGVAALFGTMNRDATVQYRAARAIERLSAEGERSTEDLADAKELLQKATDALVKGPQGHAIDVANEIDGFLDMVRCAKCGERIQHAGFLGDTGQCVACDRTERKGDDAEPDRRQGDDAE